jgi:hypothetical protein
MAILATQNAIQLGTFPVIRTVSSHVPKFFAIATLHCGVVEVRQEIPGRLVLHFGKKILVVVFFKLLLCSGFNRYFLGFLSYLYGGGLFG